MQHNFHHAGVLANVSLDLSTVPPTSTSTDLTAIILSPLAVGAGVFVGLAAALILLYIRRRRKKRNAISL